MLAAFGVRVRVEPVFLIPVGRSMDPLTLVVTCMYLMVAVFVFCFVCVCVYPAVCVDANNLSVQSPRCRFMQRSRSGIERFERNLLGTSDEWVIAKKLFGTSDEWVIAKKSFGTSEFWSFRQSCLALLNSGHSDKVVWHF